MEKFWESALKVGGPVTIVAFILYVAISNIFKNEILVLFGNNQIFIIAVIIISGLLICLLATILTFKKRDNALPKTSGNKAVFKGSTVEGDVVLGDKTTNNSKDKL